MRELSNQASWQAMLSEDIELTSIEELWNMRYRIQRSAEGQQYNEPNQDCAMIQVSGLQAAFTICDGVSLSFCGQLSAQVLAYALTNWMLKDGMSVVQSSLFNKDTINILRQAGTKLIQSVEPPASFIHEFTSHLERIREGAAEQVAEYKLPDALSPMVRDVLEEKRSKGSECIYMSGLMHRDEHSGEVHLLLVWQGDIRARLWIDEAEVCLRSDSQIRTEERWSTSKGLIGDIHAQWYHLPRSCDHAVRLVLYTDGLSLLDRYEQLPDDQEMNEIFWRSLQRPESDDMTYIEIGYS